MYGEKICRGGELSKKTAGLGIGVVGIVTRLTRFGEDEKFTPLGSVGSYVGSSFRFELCFCEVNCLIGGVGGVTDSHISLRYCRGVLFGDIGVVGK